MERAMSLYFSIRDTQEEIRKESERFIRKFLKEHGGSVDLGEIDAYVSVVYDGGNHPEYASNAFSVVHDVFLNENDAICLSTDDCEEYGIDGINWDFVYDIAMFIYENLK